MSDFPDDPRPGTGADPFDPRDVVFRPVSDGLIRARLVVAGATLLLPLVAGVALGVLVGGWTWLAPVAVVALAGWLLWLIPRQVRAMGYAEADDDLLIRTGILFRSLTVVPYGRMQFVDVKAGPLDRWCGVAEVQLHTASAHSDAKIEGLPPAEAARLRDRLTARGEARLAGL
ncbi:PH domain-containing protein [Georgenia thermotolerans]|uniref:PH domain-containing protein n=1 Tax=Georgenia thermotolerans TaxID=527326 RepID=A0A7J5UN89_9MICO|nr:PH domain-containing protein [Georgenia thermotolerans]KAE8763858.1 PH domain-containing protein [Georgenia thermotolerans]